MTTHFDQPTLKSIFDWIKNWDRIDYSWDGLKDKSYEIIAGSSETGNKVPCQEFWKGCDLYEGPNGKKYTLFHLPTFWVKESNGHYTLIEFHNEKKSQETMRLLFDEAHQKWRTSQLRDHPLEAYYAKPNTMSFVGDYSICRDMSGFWLPENFTIRNGYNEIVTVYNDECLYASEAVILSRSASNCLFIGHVSLRSNYPLIQTDCVFCEGISGSVSGSSTSISILGGVISWFKFQNWTIESLSITADILFGFKSSLDNCTINCIDIQEQTFSVVPALKNLGDKAMILLPNSLESGAFDEEFSLVKKRAQDRANFEAEGDKAKLNQLKKKYFSAIESGLTFFRSVHSTKSNDALAARYHNYELWAREHNPMYPAWDRFVSLVYHKASNYGTSFVRPMLGLTGLLIASSLTYTFLFNLSKGWLVRPSLDWLENWADGMSFAISRMLPFINWDARITYPVDSFESVMRTTPGGLGLAIHATATLQTTMSAILLFLLFLAWRRRFRVTN